jgi:hypothetical protein
LAKRLVVALLLVVSAVVLAGQSKTNPADREKCLAACNKKCEQSYNTCVQNAKTDSAKKACQKSKDLCGSVCVNKECSR